MNNYTYYGIGLIKDVTKSLFGFYLLAFDPEITGLLFAKMSFFFVLFNLVINIDCESIIESEINRILTNLESIFVLIAIPVLLLIDFSFSFYCLLYLIFNYGDLYLKTYLIESKQFKLLNKKKIIEFIILTFVCFLFLTKLISNSHALLLYISSSGISSWFILDKYHLVIKRFYLVKSKSNLTSFIRPRSLSLLIKNLVGNMDILLIGTTMSYSTAGEYKLLKSFGNLITMVSTLISEKLRQKYIRDSKKLKDLLLFSSVLIIVGLIMGLMIYLIINLNMDYLSKYVSIIKIKPIFIVFSLLISISGIYRVYYLYMNSMVWNLFSQIAVLFSMIYLFFTIPNTLYPYLIYPQLIALMFFIVHVKKNN